MRGLVRSLVGAMSVAAGSWISLHAAEPMKKRAPEPAAPIVEAAPPPVEASAELPPWPRLNPEANMTRAWRLAEGPHRKDGDKRRLVTLTFDDGPFPETTPRVLELLSKYGVHATFFVIGRYLDGNGDRARATREVLESIVAAGHLVGNHTHDHALLTAVSHTQVLDQIDRGAASIERVTGKRPILFRPPFGELDPFGQDAVRARGLDVLLWNIEAQDMERDDASAMFREITSQLRYAEGGVVLLHDIRWSSVHTLEKLLAWFDAKRYDPARPEREGYEVVDMPTYLREVHASPPLPGARPMRRKPSET
jgi:peptidoglycan-N-acetylglucosamine deacetylase